MSETAFQAIDLSQLPPPELVEQLDYEIILARLKTDLIAADASFEAALQLESDPVNKLLEICAFREMNIRSEFNARAQQTMMAFATGANLEHLAANLGVARLTGETDASLRARAQLALEAYSVAGPQGAYYFHTLTADADVKHAYVTSPQAGDVQVTVLSNQGNGASSAALLNTVEDRLNDKRIRPLTDQVFVQGATIIPYEVTARLIIEDGPDPELARAAAEAACRFYADGRRLLGRDITRSGLLGALHAVGVTNVLLDAPAADVPVNFTQAGFMSAISVTVESVGV